MILTEGMKLQYSAFCYSTTLIYVCIMHYFIQICISKFVMKAATLQQNKKKSIVVDGIQHITKLGFLFNDVPFAHESIL